jgi:hypothetical protein
MIGSDLTKNIYKTPTLVFFNSCTWKHFICQCQYTSSHTLSCTWNRKFGNHLQLRWHDNTPFVHSRFDSKIIRFHKSYFPYNRQNGTQSSKSNGKDNEFECNFLIFCRPIWYHNFIANRKCTSCNNIKFWIDYGKIYMLFSLNFTWKGIFLPAFKGK